MNTVTIRDKALDDQMRQFEAANQDRPMYIVGFYSAMIRDLAVDKITDYTYAMELLRRNTK